ncbi:hypothetical protein, partial [Pseudomonas syringae]|uniref:hypothetical protein n=1 Tax=Pseudomonas syringae TaxID=317 RepID=UPI000BFFDADE
GPVQGVIVNSQPEESDQVRRNGILGRAIGLDAWEVAQYVTNIQRHDSGSGYAVHFSIETPDQVRKKVAGWMPRFSSIQALSISRDHRRILSKVEVVQIKSVCV